MGTLSPIHWILVAIVVLLVFGPKALAKVGRSVGRGVRSVNKLKSLGDNPVKLVTAASTKSERPRAASSAAPPGAVPSESLADVGNAAAVAPKPDPAGTPS